MPQVPVTAVLTELATTASPGPAELDRARLLLADYLAVASAGAAADSAVTARRALLAGSAGAAAVFGSGAPGEGAAARTAAIRDAALVNGISAHSLELDDTHEPSSSHPGTVIWTALLAAGPAWPAGTGSVLAAAAAGYQVMASLGELLGPAQLYRRGLHPTAVCGVFGAAAAVGRLAGLDAAALGSAFGIALSLSAGSMAYLSDGAWTKRMHSGTAAAGGILAVQLAAGGFAGPADAFGDPYGLLHIYGAGQPEAEAAAVLEHAGGLPAVHETSIKFHPCCRYMHGVMDLLAAYRSEGGSTDGLTRIDCGVLSGGMGLVGEPLPRKRTVTSMVDAQFSMPFGAALTLSRGASSLADFQQAGSLAAELQPLMDLAVMHTSPRLDAAYPAQWGAEVTLTFAGQREPVQLYTPAFRGSPGWPVGRAEVAGKAAGLIGEAAAGRLLAAVDGLGDDDPLDAAALIGAAG